MKALRAMIAAVSVLLLLVLPVLGQKYPPHVQKAMDIVIKHMNSLENGKGADIQPQPGQPAVRKVFPDHVVTLVRFRVFPVARIMPKDMAASNLLIVNKEGKIEHVKDVKALQKFFAANQVAVKNEQDAKQALAAWLALTQEFHQDGGFKFEVLEKEFAYEDGKASGRFVAMQGGKGELKASLSFDKEGKLAKADETAKIMAGPRPICQATKLLDADPIVRKMAETELLYMGLFAREYMMEQRERATPELRQAIDRVWLQIEKNGW